MNPGAAIVLSSIFLFSRSLVMPVPSAALQVHATGTAQPMSVPQGAQHAVMLTIDMHAGCAANTAVTSVTVHHEGLGAVQDILRVYAVDSATSVRLTRAASFSGHPPAATLRFLTPLTITACSDKTVLIEADISPTAAPGGEHALTLNGSGDIVSTAPSVEVTADTGSAVSTVPATPVQLDVTFLPVQSNDVLFGSDRTIARFQLASSSDHTQTVRSVMLTNDGTAAGTDLQNLYLTTNGGKILTDTLTSLAGRTATFVFDPPLSMPPHALQLIQVHADVRASKRYTIDLILDQPSDLNATDASR
ncbi:MAG TPA: hypothetical protein VHA78_01335 [Candidatus Peribacteraceae bacterium]|nr:hypothetical protein [Candidatus Peribacteraceae bacterium]